MVTLSEAKNGDKTAIKKLESGFMSTRIYRLEVDIEYFMLYRRWYFIKNLKRNININDVCNLIKVII